MDGFENKGQVLGFLCNQTGVDGASIGKIDLFDSFAFIGVSEPVGEVLINRLNGRNIENRDIRIEFSKDKPRGDRGSDRGGYKGGSSGNRGGNRRERTSSRSSYKKERRS